MQNVYKISKKKIDENGKLNDEKLGYPYYHADHENKSKIVCIRRELSEVIDLCEVGQAYWDCMLHVARLKDRFSHE